MTAVFQQITTSRSWLGTITLPPSPALQEALTPGEKIAALIVCVEQGLSTLHPDSGPIDISDVMITSLTLDRLETVKISVVASAKKETELNIIIYDREKKLAEMTANTLSPLKYPPTPLPFILLATPRTPITEALAVQLGKQNHDVLLIDPLTERAFWQENRSVIQNPGHFLEVTDVEDILLERGITTAFLFAEATTLIQKGNLSGWPSALFESLMKFQQGTIIELTASTPSALPSNLHGLPVYAYSLPMASSDESASEVADQILMSLIRIEQPPTSPAPSLDGAELSEQLHTLLRRKLSLPSSFDLSAGGLSLTPGWDSLRHIQLLLEIEEHFEIEFTSSEIEKSARVEQIERLIIQKVER